MPWGLSPLARGNLLAPPSAESKAGPIPARAGEPAWHQACRPGARAYPRSRGGTSYAFVVAHALEGLSPLARGNQLDLAGFWSCKGPIPARAGEPKCWEPLWPHLGAYPRSRGGTVTLAIFPSTLKGLSPLARGNHFFWRSSDDRFGPIPARAGEPKP